ncbi:methylated-DNA--[protein]-cysteine S-methyltransferase [Paraconexibacter algicola]|uniref:Methylated-DNA--protein-cysteine methyltransferase n=1 Tax=Paraconexibacter algicola TaxID=2133960 RepID=A0A2T4UFV3_9ACTN|nr:methylated-DNA--[protein]-cysteine S-methyltransferase [Paraconexibacter algicola]PTL56602.1 cysteine methyltransferase [Paraconexibacter algicola]
MSRLVTTVHHSPLGPLRLVASAAGLRSLHFRQHRHAPPADPSWTTDAAAFTAVCAQLDAYFAGELQDFDVPLDLAGTPWQRQVWRALADVPYGRTTSYGALAARLGRPTASRAVGLANGRNPLSIVVPCHRVVGADGRLVGYGGGLARKEHLLRLEGALAA